MKKDINIIISHILESIDLIVKYIEKKKKEEFKTDLQLQDSIIRRIEIIGEAIKNFPENIKKNNPEIPWKEIAGMRDILIHQYFSVDLDLTWQVITSDIHDLKLKLIRLKEKLKSKAL